MRYVVVFDACVLYPAPLRDLLLRLATTGLFTAHWTNEIHDEWIRSLLASRPDLEPKIQRTRSLMDQAVPDCIVTGYGYLTEALTLPDPDDRHVLAAAIHCGAQAIVTFNLKDFPQEILERHDIEAIDPDSFVENQFYLKQALVLLAAKKHRASLKAPAKSVTDYLDTLASQGLVRTASLLKQFTELI